jgi:glycosyltransferase involved in cell wall biosynthesis
VDTRDSFVSVVTPFYNTADWLAECIESVLRQSFGNFEYILVDNCSTDGSTEIAQHYARIDSRIRYVRQERFLGQTQNYNSALLLISPLSQYIKIVAADDAIYPTCLEDMVGLAERHPEVGIVSAVAVRGRRMDKVKHANDQWPFEAQVVCGRTAAKYQLLHRVRFVTSPTTVLYRSAIVRKTQLFFDDRRLHADMYNYFEILRDWDLGFISRELTFVRSRDEGVSAGIIAIDPRNYLLDEFMLSRRFGPEVLTGAEFEKCWETIRKDYLEHLARNFVFNRRKEFWQHHARGWKSIDYAVTRWTLMGHATLLGLHILGNPKRLVRFLVESVRNLVGSAPKAPAPQLLRGSDEEKRSPSPAHPGQAF